MFWYRNSRRAAEKGILSLLRWVTFVCITLVMVGPYNPPLVAHAENEAGCAPKWTLISSPNTPSPSNVLADVAAISANDVWAVGVHWGNAAPQALIEHWDGNQWKIIDGANLGVYQSELYTVDALDNGNVWAAGYTWDGVKVAALLEHWDGDHWNNVPIPVTASIAELEVISATNIWAVGSKITHWDGVQWTVTDIPVIGNESRVLNGIHAIAADDIWAVGTFVNYDELNDVETRSTLVLHYNGVNWNIVPSPNPNPTWNALSAVNGISSNDIWAVGQSNGYKTDTQPIILHWNGTDWSSSTNLNPSGVQDWLSDIQPLSSNQAVAVGTYLAPDNHDRPLVMEWNGTSWNQTDTGTTKFASNNFESVSAGADGVVWAVGGSYASNFDQLTLTERFGTPISKPSGILPTNGAVLAKTRVVLNWSDANCATHYEVVVKQDSKTGSQVDGAINLATSKYKTIPLSKGHTYFWRARGCTDVVCGAWSKWFKFTLQP